MKISHYIDQPQSWDDLSRCVILRGWCFLSEGGAITGIRLRTRKLCLNGVVGMPRPDVRAEIPSAPDDYTGFVVHGILPAGRSTVWIEALLSDGTWHLLATATAKVRRSWLPLWFGRSSWTDLILSQTPGQMQYPPRAVKLEKFPAETASNLRRPKLSIVTPSFQQARYLPETLNSILNQTRINWDYIVQDGGSTDGSVDIIRKLANSDLPPPAETRNIDQGGPSGPDLHHSFTRTQRIDSASRARLTQWESASDNGQADAIVRGFAKTSGDPDDLMAWINSDDFYLPGALAFVVDYFARHPEVDAIYGHRILVNEDSREIGRWFLPAHDDEVLRLNDFVPQETLFWRRRLWTQVGGIDPSFKFAMDWDLLLRFQAAGARIVRVPYFLACFRIHSAQKTSAAMQTIGQPEIDLLRNRAQGRPFQALELEKKTSLLRYLRRSAWIEFLWKLGIRTR